MAAASRCGERTGANCTSWQPDGTLSAVAVTTGAQFESGIPARLFDAPVATNFAGRRQYAVTGDGKRFLFIAPPASAESAPITVVTNWRPDR